MDIIEIIKDLYEERFPVTMLRALVFLNPISLSIRRD